MKHPHKIKVHKFLLLDITGGNVFQDVREKSGDVFPQGHGHDGLLNGFLPEEMVRIMMKPKQRNL